MKKIIIEFSTVGELITELRDLLKMVTPEEILINEKQLDEYDIPVRIVNFLRQANINTLLQLQKVYDYNDINLLKLKGIAIITLNFLKMKGFLR